MSKNENAKPRQAITTDTEALGNTVPEDGKTQVLIPIKFNKETKQLTLEEASRLAQLGLKFEAVAENYNTLKSLAQKENKTVSGFLEQLKSSRIDSRRQELLEKCGQDALLAEHILRLEQEKEPSADRGFSEINQYFPNIKTLEDLPQQVLENSELKGTRLLDEYLRFCLEEQMKAKEAAKLQKNAVNSSIGSQLSRSGTVDPEAAEFLKGIWKR